MSITNHFLLFFLDNPMKFFLKTSQSKELLFAGNYLSYL